MIWGLLIVTYAAMFWAGWLANAAWKAAKREHLHYHAEKFLRGLSSDETPTL